VENDDTPKMQSTAILLDRNKKVIVDLWASIAKEQFPAAQSQSKPALLNALPQLIDQIINALSLVGFSTDERKDISKEHGQQRAALGDYTLKQVLAEMRILRETMFEILEKVGGPLNQRDRDIILDSIERGIVITGAEFMKIQINEKDQELAEKTEVVKQVESDLYESLTTIEKLESEQRLRDLFVATLTHDLKNPLTAAKMSSQILLRNLGNTDDVNKLASRILSNIVRVDTMIDSLLDTNQIRAGKSLTIETKEYDLRKQVTELLE